MSAVKKVLENLDDKYKIPLLLKFTYGYSTKEIAVFLNISEDNVGARIFRAKNMVKEGLFNAEVEL